MRETELSNVESVNTHNTHKKRRTIFIKPDTLDNRTPWYFRTTALGKVFVLVFFFIISVIFYCTEYDWTIKDALNFTLVTVSTVGYGYKYPTSDRGRVFTIFLMLFGVFVVFATLQDFLMKRMTEIKNYLQ